MKKRNRLLFEPHLAIREFSVLPGEECVPKLSGWSLMQVRSGTGYWMQAQSSRELEPGMVLLVADHVPGSIRASQLGALSLCAFSVLPTRLTGLITLGEQDSLEKAAFRKEFSLQFLSSQHPVAVKMKALYASRNSRGLLFRLNLLQLFVEVFGNELERAVSNRETSDARERLRVILSETPSDELLEMGFNKLAQVTHCTPRHLGRIFHELVGMSFSDKRAEIRLARARELLATSKYKVVEVALESGYKSLSLFNLMFTRRFGTSPGRWRQQHANNSGSETSPNPIRNHLRTVENSRQAFRINPLETMANRRNIDDRIRVKQEAAKRQQAAFPSGANAPAFTLHTCSPTPP
jgi:AraC-like DNA-binding protein